MKCQSELVNKDNKYVFAVSNRDSLNEVPGNDSICKHVSQIDLQCPEANLSARLRKHTATFSQLINLKEKGLILLLIFIGLHITIHRECYKIPYELLQLAKCGKLLKMMDMGKYSEFTGKSLDETELDLEGVVLS